MGTETRFLCSLKTIRSSQCQQVATPATLLVVSVPIELAQPKDLSTVEEPAKFLVVRIIKLIPLKAVLKLN